jgi:hypothetical protein
MEDFDSEVMYWQKLWRDLIVLTINPEKINGDEAARFKDHYWLMYMNFEYRG